MFTGSIEMVSSSVAVASLSWPDVEHLALGLGGTLVSAAARSLDGIGAWISEGNRQHPVLMMALSLLLLLPPLALMGLALQPRPEPARVSAQTLAALAEEPQSPAWVEVEGAAAIELPVARDILQIGREPDNDVCIADGTVHRYHAVIERTRDAGFFITDVSGPDGNGVRVNGARCDKASLSDGDIVDLGRVRVRFMTQALGRAA